MHKFPLFFINSLSQFVKSVHHVLFCHLSSISYFTLFLFKFLLLQGKFVTFLSNLTRQLFKTLTNLWDRFLKQNTVMSFVISVNYTLTANWRNLTLETKVRDFFIRMILAEFSHLSVGLICHRNIACTLFYGLSEVFVRLPSWSFWFHYLLLGNGIAVYDFLLSCLLDFYLLLLHLYFLVKFKKFGCTLRI